ncbi:MAG: YHS domain-containing (seleno)protein, partial [Nitrospiraceae bacterium]
GMATRERTRSRRGRGGRVKTSVLQSTGRETMSKFRCDGQQLTIIMTILVYVCVAPWSFAGEFYEKGDMAIKGYDPVAYFTEQKAVIGLRNYKSEYKGSAFHFASQANRDAFAANPERFAPQYGGYCAFGTAKGYKAAIDPDAFTIVENKLYLNYSPDIRAKWQKDIQGYIKKADRNWPDVQKTTKVFK